MSKWGEVYRQTVAALERAGFPEAEAEAKVLTAHVYGGDFSSLCLRFFDKCSREEQLDALLKERLTGRPLAYVLKEKYFYGRRFFVDERVLIPRYDSESVAEHALALTRKHGCRTALDLCCGSGILGVTLGAEAAFERIVFADVSQEALTVARRNAQALIPTVQTAFSQGDFAGNIEEPFDLIVCNPPYIGAGDYAELEAHVRDYEPQNALLAEHDGYLFYERAARELARLLNAGGFLVLETGDTQAERVRALLADGGFGKIESGNDLSGRPRWVSAQKYCE